MHYDISFPNLGIYLEHVGKTISVFGFEIAYYGIIIGVGILAGFLIAVAEAERTGQNPEDYMDMGMIGVVFGFVGARLYYVVFSWDQFKDNPLEIFNLRGGGLAIYGGIIAAIVTALICAKVKKLSAAQIFDTIAMSLVNGQMLGRWGNFFNREVFGEYTDSLFAMRLPLDAVRASDVSEKMKAHLEQIGGVTYIQVHPTFLYESLWCAMVLLLLFLYRKHKKYEGELFLLYLFGYSAGRVWIEGVRTDQLFLPGTTVPVSQLLSGILLVVTGALLLYLRKGKRKIAFFPPVEKTQKNKQSGIC